MADQYTGYESNQSARGGKANLAPIMSDRGARGRKFSGALSGSAAMSLGLNSPKGLATPSGIETMPAFVINTTKGIPDKAVMRTGNTSRNRMESLMSMPAHKSGTKKFDKVSDMRTIAPLTSEDINQFNNLSLMGSLRSQQPSVTHRNKSVTVENPPSFYEDDLRKRQEKYTKAIKDRAAHKRTYFSNERRTILAGNDNFAGEDADKKI